MSRGFIAALIGIAMTLFAWYGPWAWPAWPAFTAIDVLFGGHTAFADRPYGVRAAIVTALIVLNVTVWGVIAYAGEYLVHCAGRWRNRSKNSSFTRT